MAYTPPRTAAGSVAGVVDARETVEHVLAQVTGDARSVVGDGEFCNAVVSVELDGHARVGMSGRVVDDVRHDSPQMVAVPTDPGPHDVTASAPGGLNPEQTQNFMRKYAEAGGDIKNFNKFVIHNVKNANLI